MIRQIVGLEAIARSLGAIATLAEAVVDGRLVIETTTWSTARASGTATHVSVAPKSEAPK